MEAEIVAALIASPVAITAAVAAYGAGKAQGRAAVDSVRRASQRESYAHLLAASYAFMRSAEQTVGSWSADGTYSPPPLSTLSLAESVRQLDAAADRINEAAAVVTLDGPPHIAKRGQAISRHAEGLVRGAKGYQHGVENPRTDGTRVHTTLLAEAYSGHLAASMDAFAKEASAYLNSGKLPQRHRWPFSRTSANG